MAERGRLRIAYMGSPDFAVPALARLMETGHEVVAVYAQPPRPAGRGQKERPTPVHAFAQSNGLEVRTPTSLKASETQEAFRALDLDLAVVAAYGLILPAPILAAPRLGCVNLHASLLPRWRGAAPIQRALLAGDTETGITLMQMDEGLDTGAMLAESRTAIDPRETPSTLHDRLAELAAALLVAELPRLAEGAEGTPQPEAGITYAAKLSREEGRIDWAGEAAGLDRQVRALTPWPGAFFMAGDRRVKLLEAEPVGEATAAPPGTLLGADGRVACGGGSVLRLRGVQPAGKAAMGVVDFLNGWRLQPGARFT